MSLYEELYSRPSLASQESLWQCSCAEGLLSVPGPVSVSPENRVSPNPCDKGSCLSLSFILCKCECVNVRPPESTEQCGRHCCSAKPRPELAEEGLAGAAPPGS